MAKSAGSLLMFSAREHSINIITISSIYNKLQRENTEHLQAEKLQQVGWKHCGNIDKWLEEILLIEYKM